MNVHEAPRTPEERAEILRRVGSQKREMANDRTKVTCAGCGRRVLLRRSYRCFFCLLVFCRGCARTHFGPAEALPRLPAGLGRGTVWDLLQARQRAKS